MTPSDSTTVYETIETEDGQILQRIPYNFSMTRRGFVQALGAGIVIVTAAATTSGQQRGGGRGGAVAGPANLLARLHIARDGVITVMSGKVEGGQGARTQITQAAAEELGVPLDRIRLILADTDLCPNDGPTFGSRTTPSTLPSVRNNCAAVRDLLLTIAAQQWNISREAVRFQNGSALTPDGTRTFSYADLASSEEALNLMRSALPQNVSVTPVAEWKVMGKSTTPLNSRELVTGAHVYPSAMIRPGMLYGKILRAPAYGARLRSVDVSAARAMDGVVVVQDGEFVAVAAKTTYQAKKALEAIAKTAQWDRAPHPASKDLPNHLRRNVAGGLPGNSFTQELSSAAKVLKAGFDVAYVQHCPMEPRAAVAEWENGKLTVWTAGQNPLGVKNELVNALRLGADRVRVIMPDFGGAFGGKHTGETAIEAARLAQAAEKPVTVRWTREEEFTWAAFRSAAAIDVEATLDANGTITSWHYAVIQQSNAAADTPYRVGRSQILNPGSNQPLRLGSYRALGSTANVFAREVFMDELASAAGKDPLEFRLSHLDNPRLRDVLEDAAKRFDWSTRRARREPDIGVGLACGIEKGSFVAACAEIAIEQGTIKVRRITETFECGAIVNPVNLHSQVQGAIIQGLGPALREEMEFENGVMLNASFFDYKVPRFTDLPELDIHLLNRPDLPSQGAGETPLIPVAAAIANAVYQVTGKPPRRMPIRLQAL